MAQQNNNGVSPEEKTQASVLDVSSELEGGFHCGESLWEHGDDGEKASSARREGSETAQKG